jgi:hypothetical protein
MFVFANSPKAIIIAAFCSMAIIAFTYFVIVKPQTDNANKQVDKALNQFGPSGTTGTGDVADKAKKIQDCIAKAGTDVEKAQACATKF